MKFKNGDCDSGDSLRSGTPSEERLKALFEGTVSKKAVNLLT